MTKLNPFGSFLKVLHVLSGLTPSGRVLFFNKAVSGLIGGEAKWLTVASGVRLLGVNSGRNFPASPLCFIWGYNG